MPDKSTNAMKQIQEKKYIAEQIWLHYYNDYLFAAGIITEQDRNKLKIKINSRHPSAYA